MDSMAAMENAQIFHYACRVPIAVYSGMECVLSLPEERQTASLLLSNTDPLRGLDADMQQLYIPQHLRSPWREQFIFLNCGEGMSVLTGPYAMGDMDETRMRRLFRMLRPMVSREGSLRKYLSGLAVLSGETGLYLGKLLCRLFVPGRGEGPGEAGGDDSGLSPVVRDAARYIDSHIADRLTAQTIADSVNVHRDYLSARFKKETGIAMMVYIQKKRVEQACRFLRFTRYSLQEIAQLCQFSSPSRFSDIFKRHTGMTPHQYREEMP